MGCESSSHCSDFQPLFWGVGVWGKTRKLWDGGREVLAPTSIIPRSASLWSLLRFRITLLLKINKKKKRKKENQRTIIKSTGSGIRRLGPHPFLPQTGRAWCPGRFPALTAIPNALMPLAWPSAHLRRPFLLRRCVTEVFLLYLPPVPGGGRWGRPSPY